MRFLYGSQKLVTLFCAARYVPHEGFLNVGVEEAIHKHVFQPSVLQDCCEHLSHAGGDGNWSEIPGSSGLLMAASLGISCTIPCFQEVGTGFQVGSGPERYLCLAVHPDKLVKLLGYLLDY